MMLGALTALFLGPLLSAPADAQIYFSDDFNDPVQSKDNWEVITGDWQVADGVYHQLSTADPWLVSMVAPSKWKPEWVEYTIEFNVKPLTTGDAPVNVLFRVQEPVPKVWADRTASKTHMYRWIVNGYTNTESRPYIYDGGTTTMLAQTKNTMQVGTWYHLMLVVTKTDIAGYVNDVEMFNVKHAKWTDGRVGLHAYNGKMDFDDLIIYGPQYLPPWRLKAKKPDPANGTVGVQLPLFRWSAGADALFHNLYVGTAPELGPAELVAPRAVVTMFYYATALLPGTTYYWRVDEIGKDGVTVYPGDVWSFVTQDVRAYHPTPASQVNTVSLTPTLTWMPGLGAGQHHVYFGDSNEAVSQGAAPTDKGMLTETAFAPGTLEPLTTYFWRVDETVAGGAIKTGPVWSFTTMQTVDDFEGYTDITDSRIFDTWIDGYSDGSNGATVGYMDAPFAERTTIHEGAQSMPLDYNNVNSPFYSEAQREFDSPQNWTADGIDSLVLYVQGRPGNSQARLYVALEDTAKHVGVVSYPDPTVVTATKWIEWKIPLSQFTGVNLGKVTKLYLGVGDRQNPVKGGTGRIFIDDICVAKP